MNRNTPVQKDKINYLDARNNKMSYIDVASYYFPEKSTPELEKILWEHTSFPFVGDKQKILNQLYSYYIKMFTESINNPNRKMSMISF